MAFVELREYRLASGSVGKFLDAYRNHGFAIQRLHLGEPAGWYVTEIGELNQIVHLWRYDSFEDRAARRERLMADPGWIAYLEMVMPIIVTQTSRIMTEPRLVS